LEVSLVSRVSSRIAKVTQRNLVLEKKKKKRKEGREGGRRGRGWGGEGRGKNKEKYVRNLCCRWKYDLHKYKTTLNWKGFLSISHEKYLQNTGFLFSRLTISARMTTA
jgi:hypothetical protein